MPSGPLLLYDQALEGLLSGALPSLETAPLTACLLAPNHQLNLSGHSQFLDVVDDEVPGRDYERVAITGQYIDRSGTVPSFHTDSVNFGNPVTLGPVRYMVFVCGSKGNLNVSSPLLGVLELSVGGVVEAQRSSFEISQPAEGWVRLSRG